VHILKDYHEGMKVVQGPWSTTGLEMVKRNLTNLFAFQLLFNNPFSIV
jgi:hypothetical protein